MKSTDVLNNFKYFNLVYIDHKAKELDMLEKREKTMIIRGAMGRKMPYGKIIYL